MRLLTGLIIASSLQIDLALSQDLKKIFQTPPKRDYDKYGIFERSNFDCDPAIPPPPNHVDKPKSYANAQVLMRFGCEGEKECKCGDVCKCGAHHPYYLPVCPPVPYYVYLSPYHSHYAPYNPYLPLPKSFPPANHIPHYLPFPHLPEPSTIHHEKCLPIIKPDCTKPEPDEEILKLQPEIVETVKLSDEYIEERPECTPVNITGKHLDEEIYTIDFPEVNVCIKQPEPDEIIIEKYPPHCPKQKVKIIPVDSKPGTCKSENDKQQLVDSLISFRPQYPSHDPKLLVSYPIFNGSPSVPFPIHKFAGEEEPKLPGHYTLGGIHVPEAADYFGAHGVVPEKTCIVPETIPEPCPPKYPPCGCTKYVGELNEQEIE